MLTQTLWIMITVQMALGAFDILYHHELTERLAWRASQRKELWLHGARNLAYVAVFAVFGLVQPQGLWAGLLLAVLAAEVLITLVDFVEEDRSRRLPATERVAHTLLALNYGAILGLLAPRLWAAAQAPSGAIIEFQGLWSVLALIASAGCLLFALRDFAAAGRIGRFDDAPAGRLAAGLGQRRRILVTGGTGFIGRRMVEAFVGAGHEVTVLVRDTSKLARLAPLRQVTDLGQIGSESRIDAIVNLAGEPIADGLWTLRKRRRILRSRLKMARDLRKLIGRLETPPEVLASASAIGWYGLWDDERLGEQAGWRPGFGHRVCAAWEQAAMSCGVRGVRVATIRIGLVLGRDGGMLGQLLTPFEFGLGGPMGSGRQWMSWIHLDDMVRLIAHVIADRRLEGPVNATAPHPVRNREFARALGRALNRPAVLWAPGAPLRLALGDFADELLLGGKRVVPQKVLNTGFRFEHPELGGALSAITGGRARPVRGQAALEHLWARPIRHDPAIPAGPRLFPRASAAGPRDARP